MNTQRRDLFRVMGGGLIASVLTSIAHSCGLHLYCKSSSGRSPVAAVNGFKLPTFYTDQNDWADTTVEYRCGYESCLVREFAHEILSEQYPAITFFVWPESIDHVKVVAAKFTDLEFNYCKLAVWTKADYDADDLFLAGRDARFIAWLGIKGYKKSGKDIGEYIDRHARTLGAVLPDQARETLLSGMVRMKHITEDGTHYTLRDLAG